MYMYIYITVLHYKTFSLNFNHSYFIYNCYYWLPTIIMSDKIMLQLTCIQKKRMETRIIKNIFNENDRIYKDVKTQKVCEQDWDG